MKNTKLWGSLMWRNQAALALQHSSSITAFQTETAAKLCYFKRSPQNIHTIYPEYCGCIQGEILNYVVAAAICCETVGFCIREKCLKWLPSVYKQITTELQLIFTVCRWTVTFWSHVDLKGLKWYSTRNGCYPRKASRQLNTFSE